MHTLLLLTALAAAAGDAPRAPAKATPAPAQACIEVEVNGETVRPWACLQERLTPAAAKRPASVSEAERLSREPGNRMLQYNLEGTRQRMGNALGTSVVPQRPAR
ncbi:hypothetical protein [Stenotrophomonas sp. PD6]|uniref:hypothetical protein n=1 Tax=Stenotrophomonas sp. PD6 TaxID=3368612 RepID=UPI003BA1E155